ncbi:prephenate dehydrogenase [Sulfuriflexus sp.]|uniref:prephenate dehydrogenase n=1 Tax=Sulfuriflexus sp. TaxID=2015443 RepID=UPI0028CDC1BB|nr:prephenate dehydrogenase/arogenate dehydrogenase family protein [Sulfuriflexus sp.]MDT8404885.1 prephenate dehydrogenase/arogenate dehydrogenase family protein [Sulfuriflexus sp.]
MINRLCVIGVGLIGGSLCRALRQAEAVQSIVGCGRNTAQLQRALELGVIDSYETDIATAVSDADVVVVAVPVGAMQKVFAAIKGHLKPGAVLTDVGSAKGSVVLAAREAFGGDEACFVPGHPIAGTEKSGVEASFAELFNDQRVILTPLEATDPMATQVVHKLWQATGAEVISLTVEHHDEVLAATSHLPHVIAYALVDTLARMHERREMFQFAAGGFRDFTRIASSDPQMWHDICLANKDALLDMIRRFSTDLAELASAIENEDSETIKTTFSRAKQARDQYC